MFNNIKKGTKDIRLRFSIVSELIGSFWKYKLWWGIPIVLFMLVIMGILIFAGHTGLAAFIYPLF